MRAVERGWRDSYLVRERLDGSARGVRTRRPDVVVFGAYDHNVHFVDGQTGARILPDFETGDIIKGSVTVDPDGFPIIYVGSRDNLLRAIAIDRPEPTELWALNATEVGPTQWNNDWDGSPLVLNDHLIEGGENSRFHIVKLNRGFGPDGLVTVNPEVTFHVAGWDDELLGDLGDRNVSIEQSVAVSGDTAWFGNSGGLLQGWDISSVRTGAGEPSRTFRYWLGDDADASVVVDAEGFLYVGVEHERGTARSSEVGQLLKLDPRVPDNPIVWSVHDEGSSESGTWSTPAVLDDVVIWPTASGDCVRPRPRERCRLVGGGAPRAHHGVAGGGRRRVDPGRLQRRSARLRRLRPAGTAATAMGRGTRWLHRGDTGGMERTRLRGHAGGTRVRAR